jgi:hypothetical protein
MSSIDNLMNIHHVHHKKINEYSSWTSIKINEYSSCTL